MNIARGEQVEKELDAMIERRSQKGETDPDEREELWKESETLQRRRQEENRFETDYGLRWNRDREVWTSSAVDGFAYDGSDARDVLEGSRDAT